MIRFRCSEDERRYLLLVGDLQRQLATHLPAAQVSVAMRNLGKMQDLLMMEGVRQGVAIAAVARHVMVPDKAPDLYSLRAFALHATVYENHDTPLVDVERSLVAGLATATGDPWLDPEPMRFAPVRHEAPEASPPPPPSLTAERARPTSWDDWTDSDTKEAAEEWTRSFVAPEGAESAQERPEVLDRARSALLNLHQEGYRPGDWAEMILRLHLTLQLDAGFLDIQMGTPMGLTVLAQAGYVDLRPPAVFNQTVLRTEAGEDPG